MNKTHLAAYAAVAVLCIGAGVFVSQRQAPASPPVPAKPPTVVDTLFAQTMNDASGKPQALSQWKGELLVVNFWAPWCAPCVEEMPALSAMADKVKIIGIGIDSPSNIAQFSAKYKIAYPLYVAGLSGTDLARQFGNTAGGLPYTVIIGRDGTVKKSYLGRLKFDQLKADLASL